MMMTNNKQMINSINFYKFTNKAVTSYVTTRSAASIANSRREKFDFVLNQIAYLLDQRFDDKVVLNEETQKNIEFTCINPVTMDNTILNGLDLRVLNSVTGKFLVSKEKFIDEQVQRLIRHLSEINTIASSTGDEDLMLAVLAQLRPEMIRNIIYYIYHVILSNQNTDNNETACALVSNGIAIGKALVRNYMSVLIYKYREENGDILFNKWKDIMRNNDPHMYDTIHNDSFLATFGIKIIEIMENLDLVKKDLVKKQKEQKYFLSVTNKEVINIASRDMNYPPTKLPMIVNPKNYKYNNGKGYEGGYLLNEVDYSEELFIDKKAYKVSSITKIENIVFDMVNGVSSTPFRINKELLSFIKSSKIDLLLPDKHQYDSIENKTKYHISKIKAHNSKVILQNTILKIAECFELLPQIYFPVRLDQRGRMYCEPQYFNYQSNELARALILFSKPSIISKSDLSSSKYLKILGANYFGFDKRSVEYKLNWVDSNIHNIINYDNGILLDKAKEKILFLSFCIEYAKFTDFILNENETEFNTYLPIQLDATCNGFQHMALLSGETLLFDDLNLVNKKKNKSSDFYTFVLHRVKKYLFNELQNDKSIIDKETLKRLDEFDLHRSFIKKGVMTIPYNSSHTRRKDSIENSLIRVGDWDKNNQVYWYWDGINQNKLLSSKDLDILTSLIKRVIEHDHGRISKLNKYMRNIASLFVKLQIPISWDLPTGLVVSQSYLNKKSTSISPFQHSKIKLNLLVTLDSFDKNKQIRSLMPNLIHSLDASSLCMLYNDFSKKYDKPQFYSVHDCFATTFDKVDCLKSLLASVYTSVYIDDNYLTTFDSNIIKQIKEIGQCKINKDRIVTLPDKTKYQLHSIDWVLNKEILSQKKAYEIDSQFIVI